MQICHALLKDRCIVVSGVGAGLGRKLALQCAQHGAKVVLGARSPGFLNDVATEIAHAGGDAIAVPCDVTQQHERRALMGWMDGEPLRKNFDSRATLMTGALIHVNGGQFMQA